MGDGLGKRFSDFLGKMDEKLLRSKINAGVDMLKNSTPEELRKKLEGADINKMLNELDKSKLGGLSIDKDEIRKVITEENLEKVSNVLGSDQKDVLINKINSLLDNN